VPSENTYGSDLRPEFIELGYGLFKDKGKIKTTFLPANVFDDDTPLTQIYGQISIVYTGSFFHLFNYEEQVVGRHIGNENPGDYNKPGYSGERGRFRHNPQTWTELWDEVGEATGTQWKVEAELQPRGSVFKEAENKLFHNRRGAGARRLKFVVRRV
jgi:hypothetical protein